MQPWLPSICNLTKPLLLKFYILFPLGKSLAICDLQLVFKNWLPFQMGVLLKHPKLFVCQNSSIAKVISNISLSQCLCPHHRGPGSCLRVRTVGSLLCLRSAVWDHLGARLLISCRVMSAILESGSHVRAR